MRSGEVEEHSEELLRWRPEAPNSHSRFSLPLTWVSVHVQVLGASEGKSKAGRNLASSPLASDHLRRLLPEPIGVPVVDVDQALLVLSPEWTADGNICQTAKQKMKKKVLLALSLAYNNASGIIG